MIKNFHTGERINGVLSGENTSQIGGQLKNIRMKIRSIIFVLFISILFAAFFNTGCKKAAEPYRMPWVSDTTRGVTWKLDLQDDFDGSSINTSKWWIYDGPGHNNNGLRKPGAFTLENGILTCTAQMINGKIVSGLIGTNKGYTYGKFEFRARVDPDPDGVVAAAILTWPKSNQWPKDGENDIYETNDPARKSFNTFIHFGDPAPGSQFQKTHFYNASEWHTIAMEWDPTYIRIYVDGKLNWTLTNRTAIPDVPHGFHIQLDATKPEISGSVKLQVDWVKIYERVVSPVQ